MKYLIPILVLCFAFQSLNSQNNAELAKQYGETYPKDDAIITSATTSVEFSYDKTTRNIVADEVITYKILALKPNSDIRISAFYDDDISITSYKSEKIYLADKTCGNYQPEGIFHSDLKLCIYTFLFKKIGDENTMILKLHHNDVHYFTKTLFADQKYPVVKSDISYLVPEGLSIDFRESNTDAYNFRKNVASDDDQTKYVFTCENISKYKDETDLPPSSYFAPQILVIPKFYKKGNVNMSIFGSLGDFYAWCKEKVDQTKNDVTKIKPVVEQITSGKKTDLEKAKALYYWVQDNIKYIAFEEGLAGYVPESAQSVYENKFGDCKGMANLLKNMLVLAGYDARLTWLGTNHIKFNYSVPTLVSSNHVICTLYLNNKRYILDATDKYNAFGECSESISGRQILIENGNKFILDSIISPKIPVSQVLSKSDYEITDKALTGNVSICFDGDLRTAMLSQLLLNRSDDKAKILDAIVTRGVSKVTAKNISSSYLENRDTTLVLKADFTVKGQVMAYDNDLYVNIDPFDDFIKYNTKEDRKIPLFFSSREKRKTITKLHFPGGYKVKTIPANYTLQNGYLSIDVKFKQEGDYIYYTKEFIVHSNLIPGNYISKWVSDLKQAKKAISQPIIFTKI